MGTWGAGLYSSDFAADLKASIKAVARLPFDAPRLLDILRESVGTAAIDPSHEDYTSFWLVAADQFHKRGISSKIAFEAAKRLIDDGADLAMARELGMSESDVKKRSKVLSDLRDTLASPPPKKKRSTLSKPQPFVMEPGDLFIYPVSKSGESQNPYMAGLEHLYDWKPDKWGAALILRTERAFGFFAWYQPVKLVDPQPQRPTPTAKMLSNPALNWQLCYPGTCSPSHFKRIQFTKLAKLNLNKDRVDRFLNGADLGDVKLDDNAIQDISISNYLSIRGFTHLPSIKGLAKLVL